jgi:hypothetical protein
VSSPVLPVAPPLQGTKIWNSIAESTKSLPLRKFKKKNKEKPLEKY